VRKRAPAEGGQQGKRREGLFTKEKSQGSLHQVTEEFVCTNCCAEDGGRGDERGKNGNHHNGFKNAIFSNWVNGKLEQPIQKRKVL